MSSFVTLLETYKYSILFPLVIIEGPILTVIGGFLVSIGLMNAYIVLPVVIFGDIVGDSLQYALGRFGSGLLHRRGSLIGITDERLQQAREYFRAHHFKSIAQSKLIHGIGFIGLIAAGSLKIPYRRFAFTAAALSVLQSSALLLVGIFFGYAYVQIGLYFTYFAATVSSVALLTVGILGFSYFSQKKRSV